MPTHVRAHLRLGRPRQQASCDRKPDRALWIDRLAADTARIWVAGHVVPGTVTTDPRKVWRRRTQHAVEIQVEALFTVGARREKHMVPLRVIVVADAIVRLLRSSVVGPFPARFGGSVLRAVLILPVAVRVVEQVVEVAELRHAWDVEPIKVALVEQNGTNRAARHDLHVHLIFGRGREDRVAVSKELL